MIDFKKYSLEESLKQIKYFSDKIDECHYRDRREFSVEYTYEPSRPIPLDELDDRSFSPLVKGEKWGELWGSAWMRFHGKVPESWTGCEVVALIDIDAEGCVFDEGEPVQGLTHKTLRFSFHRKRRFPLLPEARGGEDISLLVEAAANEIGGQWGQDSFILRQAEIALFDRKFWKFKLDYQFLLNLLENLPARSVRAGKIRMGLLKIAALWKNGSNLETCSELTHELLSKRASESAMDVYSQGHAHLDLAWLWPIRETRRKAGRTFSTALKLLDEYEDYQFGASQPQLYQWVKEDYPGLYDRIKEAVRSGRWECQGAMWVEPDMNLISGESIVRQCQYGLRFFREEFDVSVKHLWLPDVFGFSFALPQILKKCGIDHFLSIKMSWSDTNEFPHSTFWWKGIDGTAILTHFPPAKEYHTSNKPKDLIFSEENFKEVGLSDSFVNLYGIGDGGGGPSREHIEYGLRSRDCEGVPRLRFESADSFFSDLEKSDLSELPCWNEELYLEFHRGTYTSQAKLKKLNREIEHLFRDVEFFSVLTGSALPDNFEDEWKVLLLHQFHDILPGSSIEQVNREAREALSQLKGRIISLRTEMLETFNSDSANKGAEYTLFNSLSWNRSEIISIPVSGGKDYSAIDSRGELLDSFVFDGNLYVRVSLPSMGYETISLEEKGVPAEFSESGDNVIENDRLRLVLESNGSFSSVFDKESDREWLSGYANKLLLWDDEPYRWDAWEISPFYRNCEPAEAVLLGRKTISTPLFQKVVQDLEIGHSKIRQTITLEEGSPFVKISNSIDWKEEHKMLKVHASVDLNAEYASFEIQYGTVKRSTRNNNSWQQAQFEVPGHRFADLSNEKEGFALINDSSFGYRIKDGEVEQTLLRSPRDPDPKADSGKHDLSYGYLPHKGNLAGSDVLKTAHAFNCPPVIAKGSPGKAGSESLYSVEGGNVKIEVVKPAEDRKGTVIRLYETEGLNQRIDFIANSPWSELFETDLLENKEEKLSSDRNRQSLIFKPFEIRSFYLIK